MRRTWLRSAALSALLCATLASAFPSGLWEGPLAVRGTVSSTTSSISYTSNGSTTVYSVPFVFHANADLVVTKLVSGTTTALVLGTHYSLTGALNTSGGTLTLVTPVTAAGVLTISRVVPYTQTTSFRSQGAFNPAIHERAFDKSAFWAQQLAKAVTDGDTAIRNDFGADPNATVLDARTVQSSGSTTARTLAARFGEQVNAKDYGAVGDGTTNDTAAVQAAFTAAQTNSKTLHFPKGTYLINTAISITSTGVLVEGDSMDTVSIKAGSAMAAMFSFADSAQNEFFDFARLKLDGNHLAQYGIKSAKIDHTSFRRLRIVGTTVAALDLASGWDNEIDDCEISNNDADGIILRDLNNVNNIRGTKVFSNAGVGIRMLGATAVGQRTFGVRVDGCTLESNAKGGIYIQRRSNSVRITGNHFENNAATGLAFSSPSKTVKADIIINGAETGTSFDNTYPPLSVEIAGNPFDSPGVDGAVYVISSDGLRLSSNSGIAGTKLLTIYGDHNVAGCLRTEINSTNLGFDSLVFVDDPGGSAVPPQLHTTRIFGANPLNYLPKDNLKYGILNAITGGHLARTSAKYEGGAEIWELGGDNTFGVTLDLDNVYPELKSKVVILSAWVSAGADFNGVLSLNGKEDVDFFGSATYARRSITKTMPASGTVNVGFKRIGGTNDERALIVKPVLTVLGVDPDSAWQASEKPLWTSTTAPSIGYWTLGERIVNTSPASAGTEGWTPTTSGAVCNTAWQINHVYATAFSQVSNASRCYEVITTGTSAGAGGPTTTSSNITDNTVHWRYVGDQAVVKTYGIVN